MPSRFKIFIEWVLHGMKIYLASFLLFSFLLINSITAFGGDEKSRTIESKKTNAPFTLTFQLSDYNGAGVSCNGASDGSVDMTINGGTAPFVILWSNGAVTEDLSGIPGGTYTVTVTDNDLDVQVETVVITDPAQLTVSVDQVNDVSCFGLTDGGIDISASGGTGVLTYLWSDASTSDDLSGVGSGTYTVTVTDANNCTATASVVVGQPTQLTVSIDQVNDVSCFGLTDGGIDISASGGTGVLTFLWSDASTAEDLSGVGSGTYTVTVTDANNCTATANSTVTQPSQLSVSVTQTTNVTCFGLTNGGINITASGGTGTLTYLWSNASTSEDLIGVGAGTYTVTVTDANNCTAATNSTVTQPSQLSVSVTQTTNVTCFGLTNGGINITASGGTGTLTYLWSNASTAQDLSGVGAGNYTVTVTDANNCTATVNGTINQPAALSLSFNTTSSTCGNSNGASTVIVSGGTPSFSYQWSTGASSTGIGPVTAGTYTVTVTDANSCTSASSVTIGNIPGPIAVLDSVRNVRCFGGNTGGIYISVTGGTAPITYLWSNGSISQDIINRTANTYTVTVTDANSCTSVLSAIISQPASVVNDSIVSTSSFCGNNNGTATVFPYGGTSPYIVLWSTGSTSTSITNLAAGSYTVTVTDFNGCTEQSIRNISNVAGPVATLDSIRNVRCFGQSTGGVFISAPGGVSPKTYLWSNGSVSQDIGNVPAGTYTVTVTDANSCTSTLSATVGSPSAALSQLVTTTPTGCLTPTGTAQTTPSGGTSPYTYLWSNAATTPGITGLSAGSYTVTVTDANNCTVSGSGLISLTSGPSVIVDSTTDVGCFGSLSGAIYITATGGLAPLTYQWSNSSSAQDLVGVAAGTYTVTVTDANSCSITASASISQPASLLNDSIQVTSTTCGNDNGSATVFPYGGTSPYSLVWSTGSVAPGINSLAAGIYTVTITDANLCQRVSQAVIGASTVPSIVIDSVRNVRCFGQTNGAIYISAPGGTAPKSFLWSNGSTAQDQTGLGPGTYTVTVTDASGCTATGSATVTAPASALTSAVTTTQTGCGTPNGTAEVTAAGGTTPYSYLWSNGSSSSLITGLTASTYTVTVTDANSCTSVSSGIVGQAGNPTVVVDSIRNVSCFNGSNGAVYITASAGTAPYTYLWSTFASTPDLINVTPGTYTVSVTDANGCTALTSGIVTQPAAALNDSVQVTQATCGNNNGSITSYPFNGTSPYTWLWSNSATTQIVSNLAPGLYTVTITDANGCNRQRSVSVLNIAGPTAVIDSIRQVRCFGASTGAVFISVTGGTTPLTYQWSNGSAAQDLTGVPSGTYTVTVTDANNCTVVLSGTVINLPSAPLSSSLQITNANCGAPTGSITVLPSGGTSPYGFLWSNGQTTQTIFNLNTGTYTVTITDALGCTSQNFGSITNTASPVITIDSIVPVSCFGLSDGGIYISVSGGVSPIVYNWSSGAVTQDLTGVPAGSYTVTVTDANSCSSQVSGSISQPQQLAVSLVVDDASCGFSNGSISATASGGTPPYNYQWSTGISGPVLPSISQGIYTVTVTDFNGCTIIGTDTVNNSNGPIAILDSVVNVNCFGQSTGAIYISVSNGTLPYIYQWSNGSSSPDLIGVPAGIYTVTVSDQNGCTFSLSAQVNQSSSIVITPQIINASCGGTGSISAAVTGGVPPYTYLWNNGAGTPAISGLTGGTYTLTVTDSLLCTATQSFNVTASLSPVIVLDSIVDVKCNGQSTGSVYVTITSGTPQYTYDWSNGSGTQDLLNVIAGIYTLTVTDQFGCIDTASFQINQPTAILDSLNNNPATCNLNNGSAKIYPYGGTPPYTYQWSSGCTSQTCINMTPGLHTVTVTDANGCQIIRNTTIGEIPIHVIAADSSSNVTCFGGADGAVYISVSSGAPSYSYLWSNGAQTQDVTGLNAGTYTVTVTDSVNCAVSQTFNITQPDSIQDAAVIVNATCGLFNGSVNLNATGGTGTLQYQWSTTAITPGISVLAPGIYSVTVTDINSCSNQFSYQITDIPGPVISLVEIINTTCFDGNDGSITIDVSSGTLPFDFVWSSGQLTQNISGIAAGIYTVTVTDSNNCVVDTSFTVTEPDEITATAQIDNVACGSADGSITVQPAGGSGNYDYLWNNLANTQTISNLSSGTYTVTVTDDSGCSNVFQFNVIDAGGPTATIASVIQVACFGDSTGVININISGGSAPYTYLWSNGFAGEDLVNIPAGTYTVTVSDQNNCTFTLSQTISQPAQIVASFNVSPANCNTSNGQIVASVSGGTGLLNLLWSTGSGATSIVNLAAGLYTLTVTDQTGCTEEFNVPVNNLSAPVITVTDSSNVTCAGAQNGSITVSVSGGQQPYAYSWTNTPQTTPSITGLDGNITYTLTVTDSLGCIAIRPVFISEPSQLLLTSVIPQRNDTFNLSCYGSDDGSIEVSVNGGIGPYSYIWSNLAQTDSVFGLAAGTYTVTVTDQNGCTLSENFTLTQPPLLFSNAGQNNIICGINTDTLEANIPVYGSGYWTIVSGFGAFQDSTLNNTVVTDLQEGVNVFQWVVTDGLCSAVSQVVITYNTQIVAIPGFNRTVCADTVLLTATAPQFGFGYWQVISSDGTISDTSKAVTSVTGLNFGPNRFRWIVVNGTCTDTAEVVIFRNDPEACIEDIELPTGFTPNDDNRNDFFIVKGIGDYPENTFLVYNRWGNKVYEKSGYANEWNGVNESGDPLPDGTYFIILKVRKGSRTFTGYVDLRR